MFTFLNDYFCGTTTRTMDGIPNFAIMASADVPQQNSSLRKKRARDYDLDTKRDELAPPSCKKLRLDVATTVPKSEGLLEVLPHDIWHHVLGFCGSTHDRFALQTTCKLFRQISNESSELLSTLVLGGDIMGRGSVLRDEDTPIVACHKLSTFCRAGNPEAMYMLGMIRCYCFHDIDHGIALLKVASDRGFVRATYTLGLLLRDLRPREARRYMIAAAEAGYFPALQEVLPAGDLKAKSGEPTAGELCQYLDPTSLNRLLRRHYVRCPHLRNMNTSHCWNPLCGKWAHRVPREGSPDKFGNGRMKSMVSFGTTLGARALRKAVDSVPLLTRMSRMKVCSRCGRAMYCSKLCQVYDWRSGRHKIECPFL